MAKLNHVFGNYLSLIIPLVKRTRTVIDGTETDTETEYTPALSESVSVRLLRHHGRAFSFIPTVEGSHVTIEDEGKLPPGTYDVEVKISGGEHPMCFFDTDTIEVHRATEAAGIIPGETLTATTQTLQGAVFFDTIRIQGKSAYEVAVQNGFQDTEQQWLDSLENSFVIKNEESGISALSAEIGTYHVIPGTIVTLTVTLPTVTSASKVKGLALYLKTDAESVPLVSFTSSHTVVLPVDYALELNTIYEFTCAFNGVAWVVSYVALET